MWSLRIQLGTEREGNGDWRERQVGEKPKDESK
jgi:hypothetical protein